MKIYIYYIIGAFLLLQSCRDKEKNIYAETPFRRAQNRILELRNELVNAEDGWLMTYFPDVDTLKFSDPTKNIKTWDNAIYFLSREFGKGGYQFYMKFNDKGKVEMLSDSDYNNSNVIKTSDFEVKQSTYTQLSFTTQNYIHQLLKSDFLFWKKDEDGRLIFRTNNYVEEGREYIVLTKVHLENHKPEELMYETYRQKFTFERLYNPQLTIKDSEDGIQFKSNLQTRKLSTEERYTVFVKNWQPNLYNSSYYSGLGSGYMPTEKGLLFYPGIKLKDGVVFREFIKVGNVYKASVGGYTAEITTN